MNVLSLVMRKYMWMAEYQMIVYKYFLPEKTTEVASCAKCVKFLLT